MASNTNPKFVGLPKLKLKQQETLENLLKLASVRDWKQIHYTHFDWWMFPIDEPSTSYDLAYTVFENDVLELASDSQYMRRYREGADLLARSWGWDLQESTPIVNADPDQCWQQWPIRLWKATRSLQLFGEEERFQSFRLYGQLLIARGEHFIYPREPLKDLVSIFR